MRARSLSPILLACALLACGRPGRDKQEPTPVSAAEAADMLDEIKGVALLRGFRGAPRGDLEAAAKAIAGFSRLALSASVSEAEINPLLVGAEGDGAIILDALVRIA